MSTSDKYIVWQSYTGTWNCGLLRYDFEDPDFSELYTGAATMNEALAHRYGGETLTVPFRPHDRNFNDMCDRGAHYRNTTAGPRIVPDPDVVNRDSLADAERNLQAAKEAEQRVRWENRNWGLDESARRQLRRSLDQQEAAQAKIDSLKPLVAEADARMPAGPFYTPGKLRQCLAELEGWPTDYASAVERHSEALNLYDGLIAKAEALHAEQSATNVVPVTGPQGRQPKGIPVGGQFATRERGDTGDLG